MRGFCTWLWKRLTAEWLAVAMFLAVAVALWWGMQSRPVQVITFLSDTRDYTCHVSPDGQLCLVHEDGEWASNLGMPSHHRLRVFDLATGQEVWHWYRGLNILIHVTWTKRNHLYFFLHDHDVSRDGSDTFDSQKGEILGFDPRAGTEPVFHHRNEDSKDTKFCFSADGDTLVIRHVMGNSTRFERVDLRTGKMETSCIPWSETWARSDVFSPDGSRVLYWRPKGDRIVLQLYDIQSSRLLQEFPTTCRPHEQYVAAFSPDGRLLAASEDKKGLPDRVRVWDVGTGKLVATLEGCRAPVPECGADCFFCAKEIRFLGNGSLLCIGLGGAVRDPQGETGAYLSNRSHPEQYRGVNCSGHLDGFRRHCGHGLRDH
jgi:WD40 repeat protein